MDASEFNQYLWLNIATSEVMTSKRKEQLNQQELDAKQGLWVEVYCQCIDTEEIDVGIGEYEFWGSVYYDRRTETVPSEFEFSITGGDCIGRIPTDDEEVLLEEYELTEKQCDILSDFILSDYR